MRVLHVIPAVAPRYGGPSRAVVEMCHALQHEGLEPVIATTDADGAGRLQVECGKPVPFHQIPTLFFPRQWSEALKLSYPLARWLDDNISQFDVVHIHAVFSHACLAAAQSCRRHSVPYVVRPLGTLDPWSLRQKRFRKQLFWKVAAKRMLGGAAAIHYTAEKERRLAEHSLGLKRGVVIGLGVDSALLRNESEPGLFRQNQPSLGSHPFVLVMSRIHPKKGLELLLQTFVDLIAEKRFQHWRLVIAGDGDPAYIQSLKQLARASRIADHILFPGWLEGTEKVSALRSAELLALPSHQENFGLCVVEALACGVPVLVSTKVNLCREIEAARAGWVTPLTPKDLKGALQSALQDKEQRRQRGLAGREFVKLRFSWPAIARELITLYGGIGNASLAIGHHA
jgi:glycosyltransferase involved in cell wall biosynthesis